jgi:hypothetical protein
MSKKKERQESLDHEIGLYEGVLILANENLNVVN